MQTIIPLKKIPSVYLLGAVLCAAASSLAQTAQPSSTPPAADAAIKPVASADATDEKSDVVVLSPFEVNTSGDRGYFASSTLSGTRLNSKLEDLASPISVVTKEQMLDTASLDINDIFKYEANTEGMSQFTDFTIDRNFYVENTTLNPQSSNRIRGIGSANRAVNNFSVSSIVPLDTYNIDSIEISRGPNANIFGLGNAAGTVNVNQGRANFARDYNQIAARADSDNGWRTQLDVNRALIKDHLAIRVAAVHDDKGFIRKPAYESINRLNVSAGFRSAKGGTTIRASYESFSTHFSRSNTTLPRDSITEWLANGKPIWDPTFGATGGWKLLGSTGAYTAVTSANESVSLPLGLNPGGTGLWARPSLYVEQDGSTPFYSFNAVANTPPALPAVPGPAPSGTPAFRYMESGTIYRRSSDITKNPATPLILFQPLSITDQSIYDWTSVNILSPNFGRDEADIYMVEVEQAIFNNQRHHLNLQFGYYHELIDRYDHSVFSRSDSGVPFLTVDVNEKLIDGTPNPYFLRPYMAASEPAIKATDEDNTNYRGTLAYQLDFRRNTGWTKWLGNHNVALYGEQRELIARNVTSRDLNTTDYAWTSVNDKASLPLRGASYRLYPRYYMGDAVTGASSVVDYAPASKVSFQGSPLNWFAASTRARVTEPATIQEIVQSGNSRAREIRTLGATWQGYFWDDRIIATVGWRKDKNRERSSRNLNANNPATNATSTIDPATKLHDLSLIDTFTNPWEELGGTSRNLGVVFKVNKWLNLNYSQSNSFKPENLAYNVNTVLLPNPTGESKDYGFTLKMLDDKLIARVTRYESNEKNSRNGSITSAAVTRTLRLLFDPSSSNALINNTGATFPNGSDPFDLEQSAAQWYLQANPSATAAQAQQYAVKTYLEPLGIDQVFIDRVRTLGASAFTDVNTVTSTGVEVELNYNPNRYWTMKIAGAQQKAIDTELGNTVDDFMTSRLAALRTIVVPTTPTTQVGGTPAGNGTGGLKWWLVGATSPTATGANTPSGFYVVNVKSVIGLATANAGKPRQQTREYRFNFTTNYKLAGMFENGWLKRTSVGGSLRWESRAGVGYYGAAPSTDPEYKGAMVEYDASRPIYDQARTYVDFFIKHELKLWKDKVRCSLQLNVNNVFEGGRLQAISYNPDGTAWNYRIVDPRQFILTARFDL